MGHTSKCGAPEHLKGNQSWYSSTSRIVDHAVPHVRDYNGSGRSRERKAGSIMPSGDAQRTWFPEMIVRLRAEWHEGLSISTLIGLRNELDETLHRIRVSRNIQTPIITCRRYGRTGHAANHVSVCAP
jgi:hypothetical protein